MGKTGIEESRYSCFKYEKIILKYDEKSLFIFRQDTCFRQTVIRLVDSRYFEYLIVLVILMNSITLALYDYSDRDSIGEFN